MPEWEPTSELRRFDDTPKLTGPRLQQKWRKEVPPARGLYGVGYEYEWRDVPLVWKPAPESVAEDDDPLFHFAVKPRENRPKVCNLLGPGHAGGRRPARVAASALLPVANQKVPFEIQQALKLRHLVQQRQGRAALDDQQRRDHLPAA